MACCPFHDDKHPSMKVDRRFHCFGCQADGDVIDFTSRLFGLNKKEAALKLAEDFSVSYDAKGHDPPRRRPVKRKISEELRCRQAEQKCFRVLCDYLHLLERWEKEYAPQTPEETWNPLFVEALQKKENAMSRKKQVYEKITALYCRISLDDGGDNESMSISNQKLMLRDFAEKHGMFQYEYYVDEGYTGRNFNRPSFQRMIADIEAGKIGCVITKDLSRLGRNYIEAGSYIEIFFPKHNVRYIAVTDGVDSLTRQEMDITPFKNILNDMYSRDISKKVLAGRMTRSRQGKFCGGQPPLGLMRDPEDKGHLILDPETAPVIRKIYDMALDGWGCMRIAKQLMDDKIPITRVKSNTECDVNYYSWGSARKTVTRRKWRLKVSPMRSASILASRPEKTASAILQAGARAKS